MLHALAFGGEAGWAVQTVHGAVGSAVGAAKIYHAFPESKPREDGLRPWFLLFRAPVPPCADVRPDRAAVF